MSLKRNISELSDEALSPTRQTKRRIEKTEPDARKLRYPSKDKQTSAVPFQQPSQLLTFSYSASRELEFTNSALRFYVDPPIGADLRYGYDRWVKRPEERGRLDGLLKAISRYRSEMDESGGSGTSWLKSIAVVSWRGVMTKILTAPYEEREGWDLNVMFKDGTMYFEEYLSNERLAEKEDMTPHHRLQSYYGYSFESYCTSSSPNGQESQIEATQHAKGWGGDVDTNVQWCSIVKTKLGNDRLVIGGEVDCVREKYTGKPDTFVELKTSLTIRNSQDEARFEKKLLKFYFQSFLLGVPEIVVGFRKPSGQLTTLQSFQTIQLPRLVRGKPGAWDPSICLAWGEEFITFIKSIVSSQSAPAEDLSSPDSKVWRVKFTPGLGVSVYLLDEAGVKEVEAGEQRIGFLPAWYLDDLKAKPAQPIRPTSTPTVRPDLPSVVQGWQI